MKAAHFEYHRPASLAEALGLLKDAAGTAKVIAGGQSLGPMLNLRLARPAQLVDIGRLDELRRVARDGDHIRIGAAVTHAEIEDGVHELLRDTPMQWVARGIAYRSVRNRGTIGGSLSHADPAADWVLVAVALGAELELARADGTRRIAMDDFMIGAYTTVLGEDEIVSAVCVPATLATLHWGYHKSCRKVGEFAEASCAAMFDPARKQARVAIGALDGAPRNLPEVAAQTARSGSIPARARLLEAVAAAAPDKDAVDRQLLAVAIERALKKTLTAEPAA